MPTTVNFNFELPDFDSHGWHEPMHDFMREVDALLSSFGYIAPFRGGWRNSTSYTVGDVVSDGIDSGALYTAAIAHMSPTTGTFSEFRGQYPTYWTATQSNDVLPRHNHGTFTPSVTNTRLVDGIQEYATEADVTILDPHYVRVYIGGVRQVPVLDYNMSADGTKIVLVNDVATTPDEDEWAEGLLLLIECDIFPRIGSAIGYREIVNGNIATGAVDNRVLANASITAEKVASNVLSGQALNDGAVTTSKIANAAVTSSKIAAGGVGTSNIANNAVTTDKLAAGSVTGTHIADNTIVSAKLLDGAVINTKLGDGSVTTIKVAEKAITESKLGDSAVVAAKIATSAVNSDKIADASVTAAKIAAEAVTAEKIADAGLPVEKLETQEAITPGEFLLSNVTVNAQGIVTAVTETWHAMALFTGANPVVTARAVNCSVARAAVGTYTVTFDDDAPDANYFVALTYIMGAYPNRFAVAASQAAGSIVVKVAAPSGDLEDSGTISIICMRL